MARSKDFPNEIKVYLDKLDKQFPGRKHNNVITSRTTINSKDLYKIKEDPQARISAEKFYEIFLAIERPIEEVIDNIYQSVQLPNKPPKEFKKKRSKLASILFGQYTEEEIEYLTDIKKTRLIDDQIIMLASELILIELATNRKRGELFKSLFKDVKLKK